MKKVLLLLSFVVFVGCFDHSVSVVDNKRILVSGNILDTENTALENINVTASGSEYTILDARAQEILGKSSTNAAGQFSFISLDTDNSFYGISVNHPDHETYREGYATLHFVDSIGTRGNSFELVNIRLPSIQGFELKMKNTSGSTDTLFYGLSYSNPEYYRKLNENSFVENPYNFQSEIEYTDRLLPGSIEKIIPFRTLENSQFQFKYKFSAEAVYDTINVEITPENPVYEFNY
jgi:hypothetical protein